MGKTTEQIDLINNRHEKDKEMYTLSNMKKKILNPGSDEAIEAGCECPILDNGHGMGYMGQKDVFVMIETCPIHGHLLYNTMKDGE
jgi:hypothetical protein